MKAMLRTVLFLDAALNLALGVLLIASFWSSLYAAIEVPAPSPVLYAQALGVAFIGVAWLQWHATVNGQLTATVAKVTGHINWVTGAFVLGWLISGQLSVTGGGKLLMPALGALAIITFTGAWNAYFQPRALITSQDSMTLPIAMDLLRGYMSQGNLSVVMAAMSMAILPVVLLFLVAQKMVIEGVTFSGIRA